MTDKEKIGEFHIGTRKYVKREWIRCAKFIRKTYSLKYPRHFDFSIEREIDEHLKKDFVHR